MDIFKADELEQAPVNDAELTWLVAHFEDLQKQYPGQWVAINGDRVIAHGETLVEVAQASQQQGVLDAFYEWIPFLAETPLIHIL